MTINQRFLSVIRELVDILSEVKDFTPSSKVNEEIIEKPVSSALQARRQKLKKHKISKKVAPAKAVLATIEPHKKRGRPKGMLDYICKACKHAFRAVKPKYCPNENCAAVDNFVLKKDYNRENI